MYLTLAVLLIIVALILALAVITTSKANEYKHTIDPPPEEDHSQNK
ncbi:YtzI protein [Parageobacillus sp. VR-IP]|nr:YtzI protein [Parageobacillus sp. VR-IP]NUK30537.1 YtzI protein [Parageobacillus sp. VR-IP]